MADEKSADASFPLGSSCAERDLHAATDLISPRDYRPADHLRLL